MANQLSNGLAESLQGKIPTHFLKTFGWCQEPLVYNVACSGGLGGSFLNSMCLVFQKAARVLIKTTLIMIFCLRKLLVAHIDLCLFSEL